jgi:hypothetical protein
MTRISGFKVYKGLFEFILPQNHCELHLSARKPDCSRRRHFYGIYIGQRL